MLKAPRQFEIEVVERWPPADERFLEARQNDVSGNKAPIVIASSQQHRNCDPWMSSNSFRTGTELRLKSKVSHVKICIAVVGGRPHRSKGALRRNRRAFDFGRAAVIKISVARKWLAGAAQLCPSERSATARGFAIAMSFIPTPKGNPGRARRGRYFLKIRNGPSA